MFLGKRWLEHNQEHAFHLVSPLTMELKIKSTFVLTSIMFFLALVAHPKCPDYHLTC